MGKKKNQSVFDLSVRNESLDDIIQIEPRYIVRNFYSSPLMKSRFCEDDLYAREDREYRRMLRKANKKTVPSIPAYTLQELYVSPSPPMPNKNESVNLEAEVNELLEQVKQQYSLQPEEISADLSSRQEYAKPELELEAVIKVNPTIEDKSVSKQTLTPEPVVYDKPPVSHSPGPEMQKEKIIDEDVITIPEDPFFPDAKKFDDEVKRTSLKQKSRMTIKYEVEKNEKPSFLKKQKRDTSGDTKEKKSKLPSKRKIREKTPDEKELERQRIIALINQDGYYDNRVPSDEGFDRKKVRKGYFIKLGALIGATILVLVGFIYYLIFWL